ncbi:MAG: ParA family protein [Planctomycetota bacterium]|jgi:chromosome partitioning protein|nr:ParA family protein [Planctomycetota bacterium]
MAATVTAFMNQKGGVGKTTTTVNVGAIVANEHGRRVLLVDLDPQGNLSDHLGIDPNAIEDSVYNVLIDRTDPRVVIRRVHGLEVLPANLDLSGAAMELAPAGDRILRLREALSGLADQYDHIMIDCPPGLGLLTVSGLVAAGNVVVAMQAEYLAMRGISQLMHTVGMVAEAANPGLAIAGVVFCGFDGRTTLAREVKAEVEQFFPGMVYRTAVRKNVRLAEAPSRGLPINIYDPGCAGAADYRDVAAEFLERSGDVDRVEVEMERDILAETPVPPDAGDGRGTWQRRPQWGE